MFDTVYAELDCPFCGYMFRHTSMTWEAAEAEVRARKQFQTKERERELRSKANFRLQSLWAEKDGFEDIDAWIAQLDQPQHIESYRTRKTLGLAEIQTRAFECQLESYFADDEIPSHPGHYFIPEEYECPDCSTAQEMVMVKVWIEIKDHHIRGILTSDPETSQAAQTRYTKRK